MAFPEGLELSVVQVLLEIQVPQVIQVSKEIVAQLDLVVIQVQMATQD